MTSARHRVTITLDDNQRAAWKRTRLTAAEVFIRGLDNPGDTARHTAAETRLTAIEARLAAAEQRLPWAYATQDDEHADGYPPPDADQPAFGRGYAFHDPARIASLHAALLTQTGPTGGIATTTDAMRAFEINASGTAYRMSLLVANGYAERAERDHETHQNAWLIYPERRETSGSEPGKDASNTL